MAFDRNNHLKNHTKPEKNEHLPNAGISSSKEARIKYIHSIYFSTYIHIYIYKDIKYIIYYI